MSTKHSKWAFPLGKCLGIAFCGLWLAGCNTIGFKTGDTTASSFQETSRQVQAESRALDATIAALDDLASTPGTDLKPQFRAFGDCLDRLVSSIERTDKAVARTRDESSKYFHAWDSELNSMNYGVIRSQSETRRTAVSNQIEFACQRCEQTQAVVRPLVSYFADIQRALGTDLNVEGLAAVKEIVQNAGQNTRKIQSGLAQLSAQLNLSGNRLSSVVALKPRVLGVSSLPPAQVEAGLH